MAEAETNVGRAYRELSQAEWSVVESERLASVVYPTEAPRTYKVYLLIAKSLGAERIVAEVPYRQWADWLCDKLNSNEGKS